MELVVVLLVGWVLMIGLGMFVSAEKGRESGEGFILAFLFGPLGVLIAALLPSKVQHQVMTPQQRQQAAAHAQASYQQESDAQKEAARKYAARMAAVQLAEQAEFARRRAERDRRRIEQRETYLARGITPGPFARLESIILSITEWYKGASDMAQMAVWALCMAVPAAIVAVILFRPR